MRAALDGPEYEKPVMNRPKGAADGAVVFAGAVDFGATLVGAPRAAQAITGSGGSLLLAPFSVAKGFDSIVPVPGCRPSLRARTVIFPAVRVERTATRLMPASRSR